MHYAAGAQWNFCLLTGLSLFLLVPTCHLATRMPHSFACIPAKWCQMTRFFYSKLNTCLFQLRYWLLDAEWERKNSKREKEKRWKGPRTSVPMWTRGPNLLDDWVLCLASRCVLSLFFKVGIISAALLSIFVLYTNVPFPFPFFSSVFFWNLRKNKPFQAWNRSESGKWTKSSRQRKPLQRGLQQWSNQDGRQHEEGQSEESPWPGPVLSLVLFLLVFCWCFVSRSGKEPETTWKIIERRKVGLKFLGHPGVVVFF